MFYVSVISETDGHFETGLVDGFGACWLSKEEPDMVEEAQSSKPDCRHCTGQTRGEWSTLLVGLAAKQTVQFTCHSHTTSVA